MLRQTTRRGFGRLTVACALGSTIVPTRVIGATTPARRIVALDWGVAETLVALDHPPIAAAEIGNYDRTVVSPVMPDTVIDVGLRLAPNPELMQSLGADMILINPAQDYMRSSLTSFGPVEIIPIYTKEGKPYRLARDASVRLADIVGDPSAADRQLEDADRTLAQLRSQLRDYDHRPLYFIAFLDGRHVVVAGNTSLFQGVLDQLGLRNAFTGPVGEWGTTVIGIDALAAMPEARVIYLTPLSEEAKRTIGSNPLWLRLPFVRDGRVAAMPPIWLFGGLPSAMRLAGLLCETLADSGSTHE